MGMIGCWGIRQIFQVSSKRQYTFSDFQREVKGRWVQHSILGKKPRSEFCGPDADSVSYHVVVSAYRNLQPRAIVEALERAVRTGAAEYLFIGGRKVGRGRMYIESISERWDYIDDDGGLIMASMDITFAEYT